MGFSEFQRWTQNPLMLVGMLAAATATAVAVGMAWQEERSWEALLAGAVTVPLIVFLGMGGLETRVEGTRVVVRMRLIKGRDIDAATITAVQAVKYRPLREYGGWGIRYGGDRGWVYSIWGPHGVLIEYQGKRLLIGSRRAEELAAAIEEARRLSGAYAPPTPQPQ